MRPFINKKIGFTVAVMITFCMVITSAWATMTITPQRSVGQRLMPWGETLNLTDAQRAQIGAAIVTFRLEKRKHRAALCEARNALKEAFAATPSDEERVREAFQNLAAIREELVVHRAAMLAEIRPVLTLEQQTLVKERLGEVLSGLAHRRCTGESS